MISRIASLLRMQQPVLADRGLLLASGATVPTDGTDGYQVGCIFQHTDGGDETALYVNEGSVTSCDFNALIVGDDIALPLTGSISLGEYTNAAGDGAALSSAATRPVSFLFDDGGAAMTGDIRAVLSRVLLTKDQATPTLNAMRGQIKAKDGIDVTSVNAVISPVQGYLELAGTGARTLTGHVACLRAAIEEGASGTTTVAASSYYAGLELTLNSTRTYTVTGDMAAVIVNKSGGTSKWPVGILLVGPDVVKGIQVGQFAGSAATTSAVLFSTAQNVYSDGQLSTVEMHGSTTGDLTSAYSAKVLRARHVCNAGDATVAQETYGVMGQMVVRSATLGHLHAGVIGTFEGHTTGVVSTPAYRYGTACVEGRLGGGAAITATTPIAGFSAIFNGAGLASGSSVAYAVTNTSTGEWDYVLGVAHSGSGVDNGVEIVDGEAGDAGSSGKVGYDALMKVDVGGTAYYIALFDAGSVTGEA